MNYKKFITYISIFLIAFGFFSCDDYLDIQPKDRVIPTTLKDYQQLLISAYSAFPVTKSKTELRTDLVNFNDSDASAESYRHFYLWEDTNYDATATEFDYDLLYRVIFYTNEVINNANEKLEESVAKKQLLAEAHALRAYTYFELVNLFSDVYQEGKTQRGVPLVLRMDLEAQFSPASLQEVYAQIHKDLDLAEKLVQIKIFTENQSYHFSQVAINALKSRVYLFQAKWAEALKYAQKVLDEKSDLLDLNHNNEGLLPHQLNSVEQILTLDYAVHNRVSEVAAANDFLIKKYDDEDLRKNLFYKEENNKFQAIKGTKENLRSSFRTGEIYLVKAELQVRTGDLDGAKQTLNSFVNTRKTAEGAKNYAKKINAIQSQEALLKEIFEERIRELAFEGYRWFDLRRYEQKEITHETRGQKATLGANDPRYTIEFPVSAKRENPFLR